MAYASLYKQKLTTAEKAAQVVKSGDWVDYGWSVNTPVAFDKELAKRMPELENVNFRGGVLLWIPEIFKINDPALHFTWNSWHMTGYERKTIAGGFGYYIPLRYSEMPRWYYENIKHLNVAIFQTAPMDDEGFFNFGLSASHLSAVVDCADTIIIEVNKNMPNCVNGINDKVHISDIDMIIEGDNPPLAELSDKGAPTEVDKAIANLVIEDIPNGACLQLGVGAMPNTLGLMIAQSDLTDLGIHTEMYVNAFVDIALAGKISGDKKNIDKGRQVYAFAAGTKKLYDYINNNSACMAAPVSYTNDVRTISQIDNFISINNAVDIDLFGQVNAETSGIKHISGSGGQLDFVLGAYLSKGGKSFICCASTYTEKDGTISSRIRPTLEAGSVVTDARVNTHWFVTEYGKVNLKGLSTWQRAEALISVAHPQFRDQLIKDADRMHIWTRSNKR